MLLPLIKLLPITAASCARAQLHPSQFAHVMLTILYVIVAWALLFLSPVPFYLSLPLLALLLHEYRKLFSSISSTYNELIIPFDGDVIYNQQTHRYCDSPIVTPWVMLVVLQKGKERLGVVIWCDSCKSEQFKNLARVIHSR